MADPFVRLEAVHAWWQLRRAYTATHPPKPKGFVLVVKAQDHTNNEFRGSNLNLLIKRAADWASERMKEQEVYDEPEW